MSKMKEMLEALETIRVTAQGIIDEVECIRGMLSASDEPVKAETEPAKPEKTYTLAEVRAALAQKSTAGYRKEVKALIAAHGAEKLTDINPAEYAVIMKEAEAIGE